MTKRQRISDTQNMHLGSMFEAGGGQITDVKIRIARAKQRFGNMRHIWGNKELHVGYISRACVAYSRTAQRRGD